MGDPEQQQSTGARAGDPPVPPPPPHPKSLTEWLFGLLWHPPWKRRFVLFPSLVILTIVQLVGLEKLGGLLRNAGILPAPADECWSKEHESSDVHDSGVRVIKRVTTLDLQGWKPTSDDDLARGTPVSLAVSRNRFTIERTNADQKCFMHRMGTSSAIDPTVHCSTCRAVPIRQRPGQAVREWNLVFDIVNREINTPIEVAFDVDFWNAFQTQEQWWGGFRILHSTELASYEIVFPADHRPSNLEYAFVRSASNKRESMVPDPANVQVSRVGSGVDRVSWLVPNPQPDRSYRIFWDW